MDSLWQGSFHEKLDLSLEQHDSMNPENPELSATTACTLEE